MFCLLYRVLRCGVELQSGGYPTEPKLLLSDGRANGVPVTMLQREHGLGKSTVKNVAQWFYGDLTSPILCLECSKWSELSEKLQES